MAFQGDLRNVQLADLLQTLAQNRQEGVLTLSSRGTTRRVAITRDGVTMLDPGIAGRRRLGEIVLSAGLIDEQELAESLREQAKSKKFLGEVLVSRGKLKHSELERIVALQVEEEIYDLFRHDGGTFDFVEGAPELPHAKPEGRARPLPVDQVVFEAARRLDEWSEIRRTIPSIEDVYLATATPDSVPGDDDARAILERLDGRHSVHDVADALLASPFTVAKQLARLVGEGRARLGTAEELFLTARDLLAQNQRTRALRLLHRVQDTCLDPTPLDAQIAELFKLSGDPHSAARTRLKIAQAARGAGRLDTARHELELALKEWPESGPVLELLVEVLRAQGETAEELERARALAAVHREAGAHEKALAAMERVLELAPDDVTAHRDYADLCLRAQKKERAIEILELDVQRLKRENRLSDLAAVYRRILSIDATRKDVRRALAAMRRSKTDRMLRAAGLAAVVVALVSLAGFVGLRVHRRAHDRSVLDQAKERLDHGDVAGSRGLVESLLADQPTPETSQSAMRLLDRLDEAAAEATRAKRGQRDDQLSQRLEKLQAELDQKHYDTAISGCVALLREEKEPYLVDRVRGRLLRFKQTFVDAVGRTRAATKEWRSPERDEDVAPAYRRLADAFPFELTSALPNVRQVALDAASELTGPPRDWMREVVASADAYELAMTRLTPELESLKQRHLRLQTLQQLSSAYLEAARAAEAGNVERSRELLTKVLAEYGKGELSELFQKRLERLDQAAAAVHEIEQLVTQGDFELASSRTRQAGEEFKDLELLAHLRLPVLVDSVPHGARVLVDGTEVGTTPHLFRLPLNATTNVELALAHRVSQSLTLDRDGAARRTIELPRAARCGGRLAGTTLTPPVFAEGRWYVSGRDGTFHVLSIGPGAALVDRVVDSHSISGSLASPTPAPGGFLATIFDGRVVRVDATPEVPALLWTRPLADELRAAPVLFGSDVFVVTARGVVAVLALEDGTVRTTFELGKRVVGPAARVDDRLFVPLAGGSIGVVSLRGRSVERESPLGADLLGGLATDGTAIVAATATGKLLVLDPADGKPRGTVDLGDLPIDLPRVGDGYVDVALPKQVVRVDLARNAIVSTWSDVAPSGTPALVDGQIWIPCDKGLVEIVGPGSDEVLERVHLSSVGFAGAPLASELGVALLARDGSFVVLER